ncbi:hypothetical protein HKD37_18G050237 [Glycine soja]
MARTKHASYVDGCDPFHECPSPSHERDDAKERHRRLTVSTRGQRHWSTKLEPEPKPQVKAHPSNRIIGPPFGREMKLVSKEVMKILLMTHLSINSKEEAIMVTTVDARDRLTLLADLYTLGR